MKLANMMVEIAVEYMLIKDFALSVNVLVSHIICVKDFVYSNSAFSKMLDFVCSVDADCHQGYCEDQICFCLDGYAYKEDCSIVGCK